MTKELKITAHISVADKKKIEHVNATVFSTDGSPLPVENFTTESNVSVGFLPDDTHLDLIIDNEFVNSENIREKVEADLNLETRVFNLVITGVVRQRGYLFLRGMNPGWRANRITIWDNS